MTLAPAALPAERLNTVKDSIETLKDTAAYDRVVGGPGRLIYASRFLSQLAATRRQVRDLPEKLGSASITTKTQRDQVRDIAAMFAQAVDYLDSAEAECAQRLGKRRIYSIVFRQLSDVRSLFEDLQETCELASSERFREYVARSLDGA